MQRNLYRYAEVEDSLERHLVEHSRRSQAIYLAVVAALIAGLALLPVVRVGVSVQSRGIVRPVTEKHVVKAQASGFAETLLVRHGAAVEAGQELVTLRAAELEQRRQLLDSRIDQARSSTRDLELLAQNDEPGTVGAGELETAKYRQELAQFEEDLAEIGVRVGQAVRDSARARELAARSLIPVAEAESHELRLAQLRSEQALRRERYRTGWQAALTSARVELEEMLSRRLMMKEEQALYRVTSPVSGTVEEIASISAGSFVAAGEELAVISPRSDLVAEVYVAPRDIGLLRQGGPARILVDAFNYNDWGFITGRVGHISDDFVMMNDQPVFRVGVLLDQTDLRLRNGFRGRLKKGMTVQARFMVTERTLFQLLRDDINDWLNPTQAS
ncbi:MAG: HlyD family secretion protein [Gemmatimonadetes bacterium]|nr:HlyD family secretion protein [Gemmatimonadota bacterium]